MNATQSVADAVRDTVSDIIGDYKDEPSTDRDTLLDRLDEECDTLFEQLVHVGRIDQYDVDDLVRTAEPCAAIIAEAQKSAWVEDDSGLWEGLTYGVLASVAFFSLRNLLYAWMESEGYDSNEDLPFAPDGDEDD